MTDGAPSTSYLTAGLRRWRRLTDAPLLVLAIGSLPLLLLEPVRDDLTRADRTFLDTVNVVVLIAFATDYVVELCLARPRGRFVRKEWTSRRLQGLRPGRLHRSPLPPAAL